MDRIEQVKALEAVLEKSEYWKAGCEWLAQWLYEHNVRFVDSAPSPIAPEPVNPYPLDHHNRFVWDTCATAYKAHYDPIVEGLRQKLEDVSSMAARLYEENTELQNKITAFESQLAHSQPLIEQKVAKDFTKELIEKLEQIEDMEQLKEWIELIKSGEPLEGGKG